MKNRRAEKCDGRSVEKCYLDDLAWSEMSGAGTFSHRAPHRISQWLISIIMAPTSLWRNIARALLMMMMMPLSSNSNNEAPSS